MPKGLTNSRIFTNFIISYAVTLLFPLLLMSFLVLYSFVNTLKDEVEINLSNSFKKSVEQFELQLEQLQKTSLQIELNTLFRVIRIYERPYEFIDIRDEIAKYNTNFFVTDIFIYHFNDQYISSSNYACTLGDFNRIFMPSTHIESSLLKFKESPAKDALYFFSKEEFNFNSQNNLMYLNKIPVYSAGHYAFVMYLIPQSAIRRVLSPAILSNDTFVFVREPDSGRILFSFSGGGTMLPAEIEKALPSMDGGPLHDLELNGSHFSFFSVTSGKSNLEFIQLVPNDLLSKKVDRIRILFMVGMVVIILLSGFIIAILMRINYRPINNLRKLIETTFSTKYALKDRLNEIEALEYTLLQFNKENNALQEMVKSNNSIVQRYLIDCFLYGQAMQIDGIRETCELSGLHFNKRYYCIIILKIHMAEADNKLQSIEGLRISLQNTAQVQYFVKLDTVNKRVVVLLGADTDSEELCREHAHTLMQHLNEEYGDPVRIGIGNYVQDIFEVYKSYREALKVLDYNYTLSQSYITSVSELSQINETNIKYPFKLFEHVTAAILDKDASKLEAAVQRLVAFIKKEKLTLYWAKNICYDIVNTIFKELLKTDNASHLLNKPYIERIYSAEMNTFEDLENIMSAFVNDLSSYLKAGEDFYELKLLRQLILYIRENYLDPNFGLQSLADYIQMSPPYLSQYFKKNTNHTISEYITKLRMEKAKELLMDTDMDVSDIAIKVGYYSVSSFIRKFRELEALTPGQYKKKYE